MKKAFWILVIIAGGILMIVGSATGSALFYQYLYNLVLPYIGGEIVPIVSAVLTVLEYIAIYGGYSVLVGVFLILIKMSRLGRIIITIATSFGLLGLIIYGGMWIVDTLGVPLDPSAQLVLDQIYSLFTFNSGTAFAGTVIVVIGKFGFKKAERAAKEEAKEEAKKAAASIPNSKFCPNCGSVLPGHANFCNKCGKTFD
jgi:ribosomal protein L40E